MNSLVAIPVIVPLLGAALGVLTSPWRWAQRAITLVALTVNVVVSIALLVGVDDGEILVMQAGGWKVPLGITLAVDRLSAVMLVVSSLMLVSVLVYAIGQGAEESRYAAFNPVYLVLAAGVSASFVTGDLFNLFVAFEMMLVASYVLLTLGGRPGQVRSGMSYVVISLVASTFFITALALIYSATGTVNMAELSQRIPELSSGVRTGFSLLLILVFGIKAGLFPLFFWLPDSYPTAPARSPRCSPDCSPRSACTRSSARRPCSSRPMPSRARSSWCSPDSRWWSGYSVRWHRTTCAACCPSTSSATSAT